MTFAEKLIELNKNRAEINLTNDLVAFERYVTDHLERRALGCDYRTESFNVPHNLWPYADDVEKMFNEPRWGFKVAKVIRGSNCRGGHGQEWEEPYVILMLEW